MTNTHYQQNQLDVDNSIQGCPCSICSRIRYDNQTTRRTVEYQDSLFPIESIIAYADQTFGGAYPFGTAATVGGQSQVWPIAPQASNQETATYVPQEAASPFQIQTGAVPDQAQVLDMSVPERLRRLAVRYVNNPESLVNGVHLESGPAGQFQVVIIVEIGDILRDIVD